MSSRPDNPFRMFYRAMLIVFAIQVVVIFFSLGPLRKPASVKNQNSEELIPVYCGAFLNQMFSGELPYADSIPDLTCQSGDCYWSNYTQVPAKIPKSQSEELHVIATWYGGSAQSLQEQRRFGGVVNVSVDASEAPQVLFLLNKQAIKWRLKVDKNSRLQKVFVASPRPSWIEGLDKQIPLIYVSPKEICSYPYAWEDHKNPNSEYRRAIHGIRMLTGLREKSFQGRKVALEFEVPLNQQIREPASHRVNERQAAKLTLTYPFVGRRYRVVNQRLQPSALAEFLANGTIKNRAVKLSQQVQDLVQTPLNEYFVINNFQFGRWEPRAQKFIPLHPPLDLPQMGEPRALALHPSKPQIFIASSDRMGEFYIYNFETKNWKWGGELQQPFVHHWTFAKNGESLWAVAEKGSMEKLYLMNLQGKIIKTVTLSEPIPFLKGSWQLETQLQSPSSLLVRIAKPTDPMGAFYHVHLGTGTTRELSWERRTASLSTTK